MAGGALTFLLLAFALWNCIRTGDFIKALIWRATQPKDIQSVPNATIRAQATKGTAWL